MSDKKTILILDDVEDIRNYLKKLFEENEFLVETFNTGSSLIERVKSDKLFHLVLIDLSLPDMNGMTVLKNIEEFKETKNFKICIFSGYNEQKIIDKAFSLKADDFLSKQIDTETLVNRIKYLIGIEKSQLLSYAFAKTNFSASLIKQPILLNFIITGISEEGIIFESIVSFREKSMINFNSRSFCDAINLDVEFNIQIVKSLAEKNKFVISSIFVGMPEVSLQKIRSFSMKYASESLSIFK